MQGGTVTLAPGVRPRPKVLHFDHLVVTVGSVTDFRGFPGLPEHALPFKTLTDAIRLRNHIIHVLEQAVIEEDDGLREQLLTFVVAGGGFSGTEVVAVEGNATGQFARLIRRETGFQIARRVLRFDGLPITPEYIVRALSREE